MPLNRCEAHVAEGIAKTYPDRRLMIAPSAILTQDLATAGVPLLRTVPAGCSTGPISVRSAQRSTPPRRRAT